CLGHILDAQGEKMSKARGNVIQPKAVINKHGADALRWYFYTSSPPGNVRRFSDEMVGEITRRFMLTLWNVYSFFVTYANIDKYQPGTAARLETTPELDRWIISELNQLIADVDAGLAGYDPTEAGRRIESFVDYLSNWYVRRSRRRFWKSESDADKLSAYNTLYECLVTLSKLLAPFMPFLAEELYRNLTGPVSGAPESVHLVDFPVSDAAKVDGDLAEATRLVMRASSLGRAVRSQAGIKVRQPLARLLVKVGTGRGRAALGRLAAQVMEEVNVKKLELVDAVPAGDLPAATEADLTVALDTAVTPELAAEGMAREVVHRLQTMRRAAGFDIADHIKTYYQGDEYIGGVMGSFGDYIRQETLSDELTEGVPPDGAFRESFKLGGCQVLLGVAKVTK
ncbi:MAG: class I tRNA ligase family protein, partial [Chloroflexi bacterium]|nr:class I tRNA ligase family protein [Chloroflexota bacterium]